MKVAFKVVGSNPSNEGKTHVWKLVVEHQAHAFGLIKTVKRTYYIGGMPQPATAGLVIEEDMAKFDVVERPYEVDGEELMLKWLHVKVA